MATAAAVKDEAAAHRFAKDHLKAFVERVERLEEEKKALSDDIRDVYAEAKANGFDVKALRQVRMMMIKPVTSVPMTFGADPYDGMQTLKFTGAAVTFLPTVEFGQRQASLR